MKLSKLVQNGVDMYVRSIHFDNAGWEALAGRKYAKNTVIYRQQQ